jgi:hypothetical protein
VAIELRRVILSANDFGSAIASFKRANDDFLPAGTVVECRVNQDASGRVKLRVPGAGPEELQQIVIPPATLTEILIRFCIENNISLPRIGRKRAVAHGDRAALEVHLGEPEGALSAAGVG